MVSPSSSSFFVWSEVTISRTVGKRAEASASVNKRGAKLLRLLLGGAREIPGGNLQGRHPAAAEEGRQKFRLAPNKVNVVHRFQIALSEAQVLQGPDNLAVLDEKGPVA